MSDQPQTPRTLRSPDWAQARQAAFDAAAALQRGFLTRVTQGRPMVTLKLATSFDGRIATAAGESRWITGPLARREVHLMRAQSDAVLVGAGTALRTRPSLAAGASDDESERLARWKEIRTSIFGDKTIAPTDSLVKIDAPARALDAALVPITLTMPEKDKVAGIHLVIDDNPSPYAAHFEFGPAADPSEVKLRVRVNNYTNVHAVVETKDGKLHEAVKFVKASGGCSAPMGMSDEEAM